MEVPRLEFAEEPPKRPVDPDHWEELAECLDEPPGIFFPSRGQSVKAAKEICNRCVVRQQCLDANIQSKFGYVGGMSERQRRKERARRKLNVERD